MNLSFILAIALQTQPATSIPVTFSPGAPGLVLMANASGTAKIFDDSLEINLDELTVARSTGTSTVKLATYRVCLAYQKSDDVWDMAVCSNSKKPNIVIEPASEKAVRDVTLSIPTKGLPPLNNFWLVIELQANSRSRGIGTVHAFSRKDIFKELSRKLPETGR